MKALKRNCKVPFLIGGYFCSGSRGDFNGLYFTRALISRAAIVEPGRSGLYSVLAHQIQDRGCTVTEKRGGHTGQRRREGTRWTRGIHAGVKRNEWDHYTSSRYEIAVLISLQQLFERRCRDGVNFCN